MKMLQSGNGCYYEFDSSDSPIREDAWGKYYQGRCKTASATKDVLIYKFGTKYHCPEYLLRRLNVESHFYISHPNIIPTIDFVAVRDDAQSDDYQLYFIEEDFIGVTLADFLQGKIYDSGGHDLRQIKELYSLYRRDSVMFARKIIHDILQGLYFLHDRGNCIRYIEPNNMLISDVGCVKILLRDCFLFDIFSHKNEDVTKAMMSYYAFPLKYSPPEIICQVGFYDKRSDIYSVGILFFHLITGHTPYQGLPYDIMSQQLHEKMPLREIKNKRIRKIIKKATEKSPTKRYQTASEFIIALSNIEKMQIPWYRKIFGYFNKKNCLLCIILSTLFTFFSCPNSNAQNTMRIDYKDGSFYETPIESIDSITFIEKDIEQHEASLIGDWFWGSKEKGYYEVLTFNEDRSYTGYDYYLEYGYDTWTYGTYMTNGVMLYLWSNGIGYIRKYRWYVTGLTENALEVMTPMGHFIYYRIQPEVYSLKVGENSYECKDGDYYVFTDGLKVLDDNGKLKGVCEGTTYILKYDVESELIMAYKVVVER